MLTQPYAKQILENALNSGKSFTDYDVIFTDYRSGKREYTLKYIRQIAEGTNRLSPGKIAQLRILKKPVDLKYSTLKGRLAAKFGTIKNIIDLNGTDAITTEKKAKTVQKINIAELLTNK